VLVTSTATTFGFCYTEITFHKYFGQCQVSTECFATVGLVRGRATGKQENPQHQSFSFGKNGERESNEQPANTDSVKKCLLKWHVCIMYYVLHRHAL